MVFGASIDFDANTYTSRKILNFGFGYLILIVVTGYTANLAAFLTTHSIKKPFIQSIEEAIVAKVPLCRHPVLKDDLILTYPDAVWVFSEGDTTTSNEFYHRMFESFDNGHCVGIVTGIESVLADTKPMTSFCDMKLVYTESVALTVPIALPACKEFVASISYWMYEAKLRGILYESYRDLSRPTEVCPLSLRQNQLDCDDDDSLNKLTLANFTLPLLVLALCCTISTVLQFRHRARGRRRRRTLFLSCDAGVGFEEEKDRDKEREKDDNDHQQQLNQHQSLFKKAIVLPTIGDIKTKDAATMLETLEEVRDYERDLFQLMIMDQRNKEHKE